MDLWFYNAVQEEVAEAKKQNYGNLHVTVLGAEGSMFV